MKNKIIILLTTILLSTGCFNYREINELAICSAYGIDKKDDKYIITTQIINTKKNSSNNANSSDTSDFIIYESEGETIQEAFRNYLLESSKRIYAQHIILIVIGENLAKDDISNIIDFNLRDNEIRKESYVLISKDAKASEILKQITTIETINANEIVSTLENSHEYLGVTYEITFSDLIKEHLNKKTDLIVPSVTLIKGEESTNSESLKETIPPESLRLSGYALFNNNKLIDYLNIEESKYFTILQNKAKIVILTDECDENNHITFEIPKIKSSLKINKNQLNIKINVEANINESTCKLNLKKEKSLNIVKNNLENKMEKDIKDIFKKFQLLNTDPLSIEDLLYKTNNKYYKEKWNNNFYKNINTNVDVEVTIKEKGNLL